MQLEKLDIYRMQTEQQNNKKLNNKKKIIDIYEINANI